MTYIFGKLLVRCMPSHCSHHSDRDFNKGDRNNCESEKLLLEKFGIAYVTIGIKVG